MSDVQSTHADARPPPVDSWIISDDAVTVAHFDIAAHRDSPIAAAIAAAKPGSATGAAGCHTCSAGVAAVAVVVVPVK